MTNIVDNNKVFDPELQKNVQCIPLKEKVISVIKSIFNANTWKSHVSTQEVKYVWPNVTEEDYKQWEKKPHTNLPIEVTGRWVVLQLPNEPHKKGEEILWI